MNKPRKDCKRCGKRKYAYELWDRCGIIGENLILHSDECENDKFYEGLKGHFQGKKD